MKIKYIFIILVLSVTGKSFAENDIFNIIYPQEYIVIKSKTLSIRGKTLKNNVWLKIINNNETNSVPFLIKKSGAFSKTVHLIPGVTNIIKIEAGFVSNRLSVTKQITVTSDLDLSTGGWIFMLSAWTLILLLNIYSFVRIFGIKKEKIVETLEIDTED